MEFRTIVEFAMPGVAVCPAHRLALLGSCFADCVGGRMVCSGLDVHVNLVQSVEPFGGLHVVGAGGRMAGRMLFRVGRRVVCWLNDSSFAAESREACRARLEEVRRTEAARLRSLDYLFLTLGTNRCYELKDGGLVVGNCHKQPAGLFVERQMDVPEVVGNAWAHAGGAVGGAALAAGRLHGQPPTAMPSMVSTAASWASRSCCWPSTNCAAGTKGVAIISRHTR